MVVLVFLGFWAPWVEPLDLGRRISLLEWLALESSRAGLLRFTYATPVLIVLGAFVSGVGAVLRVWGAAYLGYGTVHHAQMQAGAVMADGPYRYVRNPLYAGGWCMMAALALLMPPSGALVSMTLLTVFYLRLILGEEAFLAGRLGEPYQQYLRSVPRLLPRLRATLPRAGHTPHWMIALLTELNPIGVFLTLAFVSWTYDNELMLKVILISFGISLIVRAFMPRVQAAPDPA